MSNENQNPVAARKVSTQTPDATATNGTDPSHGADSDALLRRLDVIPTGAQRPFPSSRPERSGVEGPVPERRPTIVQYDWDSAHGPALRIESRPLSHDHRLPARGPSTTPWMTDGARSLSRHPWRGDARAGYAEGHGLDY